MRVDPTAYVGCQSPLFKIFKMINAIFSPSRNDSAKVASSSAQHHHLIVQVFVRL